MASAAPDNPAVLLLAARHFLDQGPDHHPDTAIVQLDKLTEAMGGDDGLPEAILWERVRAYIWLERFEEARDDAHRLLEMRPRQPPYLEAAGRAALGCGDFAVAEAFLRDAMALAPREELGVLLERAVQRRSE
jgi:Flp pilus assembly protein TadD